MRAYVGTQLVLLTDMTRARTACAYSEPRQACWQICASDTYQVRYLEAGSMWSLQSSSRAWFPCSHPAQADPSFFRGVETTAAAAAAAAEATASPAAADAAASPARADEDPLTIWPYHRERDRRPEVRRP